MVKNKFIKYIRKSLSTWDDLSYLLYLIKIVTTKPLQVEKTPFFLNIEPTSRCNLTCSFCINQQYAKDDKVDLGLTQFKEILDQVDVRALCLNGVGEALLNKDIFSMIRIAKQRGIYTGLVSNGTLLTPENAENIIKSHLDWFSFSIDSVNKECYEQIRKGASFDLLIRNIKYLMQYKNDNTFFKKSQDMAVFFNFVTMKNNIEELPSLIELAAGLKIDKIFIDKVKIVFEAISQQGLGDVPLEIAKTIKRKTIRKANSLKTNIIFRNFYYPKRIVRSCAAPWIASFITSKGDVCPCCMLCDPEKINFGNIFKEGFINIWNNQKYQDFRSQFKGDKLPDICQGCNYYKDIYTNIDTRVFDFLHSLGRLFNPLSRQ